MHWLLMRPAVGWGIFLVVHAVSIPLVYMMGKAREKKAQNDKASLNSGGVLDSSET